MVREHLNLLFVAPYPPRRGGAAPSLMQLTTGLQRRGQNVRVLAAITPDLAAFDREFIPTLGGIRVTRYPVPYFLYTYHNIPFDEDYRQRERREIGRALPAMIEAERPDLIVAGQEPLAWYVPEIARQHGIPCVLLLRGAPTWTIVDGSFPEEESRRWLDAFRQADRIVSVSRYFEAGLRDRGLDGVSAIPNHVDLDRFTPGAKDRGLLDELDIRDTEIVVVHASKIEPRKRPLDLVVAAGELRDKGADLVYVIVGDGPLLDEMKDVARRLNVADRFHFVGWVEYERMPSFLNLADIVVQPSVGEGLSRVYLESMASGSVLVASDIPAAREVVRHGENGLLFETGDVRSLVETIQLAAGDASLRESIGSQARASVESHSLDRKVDEYIRLFHEVLQTSLGERFD